MGDIIRISEIYDISSAKLYINEIIDSNWITYTGKYIQLCINTIKDIISASKMILFALVYNCRSIIYEKTISIGTNKILNE